MSKKAKPSLTRFSDTQLASLHNAVRSVIPLGEDLKEKAECARERAFNTRSSYQLFKYWYVRSQVSKRYSQGTISAAERRRNAITGFLDAEDQCRVTNNRRYDLLNRASSDRFRPELMRARRIISEILGRFDLEALPRACAFSAGATTEMRRKDSAIPRKWVEATHITAGALPYATAFSLWAGVRKTWRFVVVAGNKVFTVPKNFEKDRTCAMEPTWNMFLQKGLGALLRRRLNRIGLLLPTAQWKHMQLAQEGSATGELATLDLSAASDTVSLAIVDGLVPHDWLRVLMDLRSPVGELPDGRTVTYEKISSMGNGYTFELETLIFYALTRACCRNDEVVSVYGDDIICPSRVAKRVTKLLEFCGFALNSDKSFSDGPFRESCGGHYYKGHDVKPFYIERLPKTLGQIINLHNDIVAYHMNMPPSGRLIQVARQCRRLVPRAFWGPMGLEGALWSEWDEARPRFSSRYQHWRVKTVTREVAVVRHDYFEGSLLAALWGPEKGSHWWLPPSSEIASVSSAARWIRARELEIISQADFRYAMTREKVVWQSVGVASEWRRLPVRI